MNKRVFFLVNLIVCAILILPWKEAGAEADKLALLGGRMKKLLQVPALKKAGVGIRVISLNDGEEIFSHNPDLPLVPASNMKIMTTAAALHRLGTDYRFKTEVYAAGKIVGGRLKGDLYLKGYGDPFLVWEELIKIARYIHGLGVRHIEGDIVADESFFDDKRNGDGWKEDNSYWYNAPLGALSVNFNTVEVNIGPGESPGAPLRVWYNPAGAFFTLDNRGKTVGRGQKLILSYLRRKGGPVLLVKGHMAAGRRPQTFYRSIDDPPRYAAFALKDQLALWGVKADGKVKVGPTPSGAHKLYTHQSKPLALILRGLNKYSNNFTAEQVLKTVGARVKGAPGTARKGLEVMEGVLRSMGVNTKPLVLADASGLSPKNRLTARALSTVLANLYRDFRWQPEFMASLPLSGVDGTLKDRMESKAVSRYVRAKTGRINKVAALSGYVYTKDRESWAFSMLMNDFHSSTENIQQIQDKLCRLMVEFSRR